MLGVARGWAENSKYAAILAFGLASARCRDEESSAPGLTGCKAQARDSVQGKVKGRHWMKLSEMQN